HLQYTTSLPRSKIFYERGFIWCALILSLSFMSYFSYTFYLTNRRKGAVTNDVSQPLYSEYVQQLASEVISLTKRKIGRAIFVWLFLLLDAGQLFHNLLLVIV
ncbi:hypothetical protein, partial [Salmonella enterica]|uniref:hypothetical protein n=1 Tax=Salmonella enterica TaxID=28901 RepID=UPI001C6282E5